MMGGVSPETCWASYKYEIKFWYTVESCWIFYANYTMMHGSTNIKLGKIVCANIGTGNRVAVFFCAHVNDPGSRRENFLTTSVTTFESPRWTKDSLRLHTSVNDCACTNGVPSSDSYHFFKNSFNNAFRITYVECMGGFLWLIKTGKGTEGSSNDRVMPPAFVWRHWRKSRRIKITPRSLVGIHRQFGRTYCLCLQGRKIRVNTTFTENIGSYVLPYATSIW